MLLQLSHFFPSPPATQPASDFLSQSPQCGPCPWVLHVCSLTDAFTFFQSVPTSPITTVSLFHDSMPLALFCSFICSLDSSLLWGHMVFLFHHLGYFTRHNSLQFHPCCHKWHEFLLLFCCIIFHCVNVPQLSYPLIYRWALRLFPNISYCK